MKKYFAFETRLRISDQKLQNFAECIAGNGTFAAASCVKKNTGTERNNNSNNKIPSSMDNYI